MSLRLATFNVENLLTRFDYTGFRNQLRQDRVLKLFDVQNEVIYQQLEAARVVAATDDTRQMTALAIADADADIICLQEVDSMAALQAFEYGYLYRMVGNGYRRKFLIEGNDFGHVSKLLRMLICLVRVVMARFEPQTHHCMVVILNRCVCEPRWL